MALYPYELCVFHCEDILDLLKPEYINIYLNIAQRTKLERKIMSSPVGIELRDKAQELF